MLIDGYLLIEIKMTYFDRIVIVVVCRGVLPGRRLYTVWLLREAIRPSHWAHALWPICSRLQILVCQGVIVLSCIVILSQGAGLEWRKFSHLHIIA